jgi:hypothetical protein
MKSKIVYPAVPPSPPAATLSEVEAGALAVRTEYYVLTFVTPYGESPAGAEASISLDADNVAQVAPPDYPYPFPIYGYNVYAASASGEEELQNTSPVLPGEPWTEPAAGLVTGTARPPTSWKAATLTFGPYTWPTKMPAYQREAVRHSNVAASGDLETIFEHANLYTQLQIAVVQLGPDVDAWDDFVEFAEQGGIFSFFLDEDQAGFTNYTLWDTDWDAAYKSPGFYSFKMKWREAEGAVGSVIATPCGGGGGGTMSFSDNETPVDSGDHKHFTLANAPNPAGSLLLVLEGENYPHQLLLNGPDYVLLAAAITLNYALVGTFKLCAWYRY